MNPLQLDDYNAKLIGRATGELGKNVDLVSMENGIMHLDVADITINLLAWQNHMLALELPAATPLCRVEGLT